MHSLLVGGMVCIIRLQIVLMLFGYGRLVSRHSKPSCWLFALPLACRLTRVKPGTACYGCAKNDYNLVFTHCLFKINDSSLVDITWK